MKKMKFAILTLTVGAIAALSGCSSTGNVPGLGKLADLTTKPSGQSVETVTNSVVQTNIVTQTNFVQEVTRSTEGNKTNFVAQIVLVTNEVPVLRVETVTNTVYATNPNITTGLNVAKTVAPFLPPPIGEILLGVLGVASAGFGALAAVKNKQAGQLNDQLAAVIHGVEQSTAAIDPAAGAKVKDTIAQVSGVLGVADQLNSTVQKLTS